MKKERNSDGTRHKSVKEKDSKNPKKKIREKNCRIMTYVGIDMHKEFLQIEAMNNKGVTLFNEKVQNTHVHIRNVFSKIPKNSKCVMESSSVWYGPFKFIRDKLGFDIILSNPYHTKAIAASKKKTDKIDAHILADLLRGEYISECYVPEEEIIDSRELVRYRAKLVKNKARLKNYIHGITLQKGIKIPGTPFTNLYTHKLLKLDDYRINGYLKTISFIDDRIMESQIRINEKVKHDVNAQLLETIPGVGKYTALVMSSEIGDIDRFTNSHKLCSYAGIVPSVRNSANTVHHGRITKRGSNMMRWLLVESVHSHGRYAPNSPVTKFYKRLSKKRGKSKAAVAAGSKMLRIIYWMLKYKMTFAKCIENANNS